MTLRPSYVIENGSITLLMSVIYYRVSSSPAFVAQKIANSLFVFIQRKKGMKIKNEIKDMA